MPSRYSPSTLVAIVFALLSALGVLYMVSNVQDHVERAVRSNFVAAGVLARMQLHGERLRRFEKELFIYVADADKRNGYAKEWDTAARELLVEIDTALMPSGKSFNDTERSHISKWKAAALFYIGQFDKLLTNARRLDEPTGRAALELKTSLDFNSAIGPGKDRFRELLKGADTMRHEKEQASLQIAKQIERNFLMLFAGTLVLAVLGLLIVAAWPLFWMRAGAALPEPGVAGARGAAAH